MSDIDDDDYTDDTDGFSDEVDDAEVVELLPIKDKQRKLELRRRAEERLEQRRLREELGEMGWVD